MSNDRAYVYLTFPSRDPALMGWAAALAGRENNRANVVLIGSANVEGYPLYDFDRTTAQELAKILRGRFPTKASGIRGGRGRLGIPSQGISPPIPSPLVITGGVYDPVSYNDVPTHHYGASHTSWYSTEGEEYIRFDLKPWETSFDIVVLADPSGDESGGYYTINGGDRVYFDNYADTPQLRVIHVGQLSGEGDYTIDDPIGDSFSPDFLNVTYSPDFNGGTFTPDGIEDTIGRYIGETAEPRGASIEIAIAATNITILEIITYGNDELSGIMVHGVGHAGYTAAQLAASPGAPAGWRESISNLAPNVIVIEAGIPDAIDNTAAVFAENLGTLISEIRDLGGPIPTCPILLVAPYNPDGGQVLVEPWGNYVAVMRTMANDDPYIAFINDGDRMPATSDVATYGLYHTNKIHGNSDGRAYSLQAQIIADALAL